MALGVSATVPITVVIPTIGRRALLEACLASVVACRPRAERVLVIDQSGGQMADVVAEHHAPAVELVVCDGVGIATGTNLGLRRATNDHILVTHDDCTVAEDWVLRAHHHAVANPSAVITGRVLPKGNSENIPSLKTGPDPFDFTGSPTFGALYPANMLLPRELALAVGGFDERPSLRLAAEDNDFCYRWLSVGGHLVYEPDMVVWHHEWRSRGQVRRQYVIYGRAQGALYAKHLLGGETGMMGHVRADLARGMRQTAVGVVRRSGRDRDEGLGLLRGLPFGLVAGCFESWRIGRRPLGSLNAGAGPPEYGGTGPPKAPSVHL